MPTLENLAGCISYETYLLCDLVGIPRMPAGRPGRIVRRCRADQIRTARLAVVRGPTSNGVVPAGQNPPLEWSRTKNVIWSAPLPGRGHASPTVVGDRVFIPTADETAGTQSVYCFTRANGRQLWKTDVFTTGMDRKGNKKTSQASSTIACDGKRLFVNFLNGGGVYTTALDLNGQQLWQTKVSAFATHQGFGSSPALYKSLVYVTTDNNAGGAVAVRDGAGKIVWKEDRPQKPNYASPIVLKAAGKDQVLVQGCDLVSSFDPLSGRKLWETSGATTECVTSLVTDGRNVFASGGYPRNHIQAIAADGSASTTWQNGARVYVPSMIVHNGVSLRLDGRRSGRLLEERHRRRDVEGSARRHLQRLADPCGRQSLGDERGGHNVYLQGHARAIPKSGRESAWR